MKSIDTKIKEIVKSAIDIHVHIGPEIIPRKYTVSSLIKAENDTLGGCVLKNHFYPTTPFIKEAKEKKIKLFGGIVLNNFVGGLNAEAIYAASLLTNRPFIVWFPTVNAANFLDKSTYEIAPEWVGQKIFRGRDAQTIRGISILKSKRLTKETISVLQVIKQTNAVLATGHISFEESKKLIKKAVEMKIKKIVITHPIYQRIDMSITMQKEFAKMGCFIEQSYSMYAIDKIPITEIVKQIKEVGAQSVILSSDVGQPFSPSPSKALYTFASLLLKNGVTLAEVKTMMVKNPRHMLSIE